MQSVSIVGIGRLGGALALALSRAGYQVENLSIPVECAGRDRGTDLTFAKFDCFR